jgi:hypothetical protein
MSAREFRLCTVWQLSAPLNTVWNAIHDSAAWPQWWACVERVEALAPGAQDGLGALQRFTWKGRLPYRVVFDVRVTRIEPWVALEGAVSGDLQGIGRWHFASGAGVTTVQYEWRVRVARGWMSVVAPLAWPLFRWNHDFVMREGGHALARRVGAQLLSIEQR